MITATEVNPITCPNTITIATTRNARFVDVYVGGKVQVFREGDEVTLKDNNIKVRIGHGSGGDGDTAVRPVVVLEYGDHLIRIWLSLRPGDELPESYDAPRAVATLHSVIGTMSSEQVLELIGAMKGHGFSMGYNLGSTEALAGARKALGLKS